MILDTIPFQLHQPDVLQHLHLKAGSEHAATAEKLVQEAQAIARPRALYDLVFVESHTENQVVLNGVAFTSRVLAAQLQEAHVVFAFIVTAGVELARWVQGFDDLLLHYWADAINELVLHEARQYFTQHLRDAYQVGELGVMNPGSLADWSLHAQKGLFALLGDPQTAIGVQLTESMLMVPAKTVSGLYFPSAEGFVPCRLCPREGCPSRRVPYLS